MTKSLNIILFGETGAGKSSLVNLIAGKELAQTSEDSDVFTMSHISYSFQVYGVSYTVWDTRGFDEATMEMEAKEYLVAVEQMYKLIQGLTASGGVDLLVLCHREGRITTMTRSNYRLFHEVLCDTKVPVALVITYLEHQTRMEDWWDQNVEVFRRHDIISATHACVTGLPGHSKSEESRQAIKNMLGQFDENERYNMPPDEWFKHFLRHWAQFRARPHGLKKCELEKFLRKRCGLGIRDAHEGACVLAEGRDSDGSKKRKRFFGL